MKTVRRQLLEKLSRELTQSELDAERQTTREANRLGDVEPARRLRAIAAHAAHIRPRLNRIVHHNQPIGWEVARLVGELFSAARHFAVDRILSTERSYRATLLGVHHGIDAACLLRDVARREEHVRLHRYCDDMIAERETLLREAQHALVWFADHPDIVSASGARIALLSNRNARREIALHAV